MNVTGFRPFSRFRYGEEVMTRTPRELTVTVSGNAPSSFGSVKALPTRSERVRITFPDDYRLPLFIKRGHHVRLSFNTGPAYWTIFGKLLWRRENVALIEGYIIQERGG